jgi:hypothetical protein
VLRSAGTVPFLYLGWTASLFFAWRSCSPGIVDARGCGEAEPRSREDRDANHGTVGNDWRPLVNRGVGVGGLRTKRFIALAVFAPALALATATSASAASFDTFEWGDGTLSCGDPAESACTAKWQTPQPVWGLEGKQVTTVAAGNNFALALLGNGTVDAWGSNDDEQLGCEGDPRKGSTTALPVCDLTEKVTGIAAGEYFGLALTEHGKVMAWGQNEEGQLGPEAVGMGLQDSFSQSKCRRNCRPLRPWQPATNSASPCSRTARS